MSGLLEWQKADNPLHILSLGAGRQSSVMYLMALAGEIKPTPDYAIFADTGNEPPHVYQQLWYLAECNTAAPYPVSIHIVSVGDIYADSMASFNGGSPWGEGRWLGPPVFSENGGMIRRKCTRTYKIEPKEQHIRRLLIATGKKNVVDWRGHTTSELHRAKPDSRKYFTVRWPLLEARLSDNGVMQWASANGHPEFKWSACTICPFRLREQTTTQIIQDDYPSEWQKLIALDIKVRDMTRFNLEKTCYLSEKLIPMSEFADLPLADTGQMSLFECDGGTCGL